MEGAGVGVGGADWANAPLVAAEIATIDVVATNDVNRVDSRPINTGTIFPQCYFHALLTFE